MFSKIVDQKASKLKFNVDGYLTNDKKRQQSQLQNISHVRQSHTPSLVTPLNASSVVASQVPKLPDP